MILYSTGSQMHNIHMRSVAKKQGYKLNQIGLYKGDKLIPTTSEEEIFKLLGMPYVVPEKRI